LEYRISRLKHTHTAPCIAVLFDVNNESNFNSSNNNNNNNNNNKTYIAWINYQKAFEKALLSWKIKS